MGKTQKIVMTGLWALLVLAMVGIVATRATRPNAPPHPESAAEKFQALYNAPDFSLQDQNGHAVSASDLRGKIWIADFIFTHCAGPCPMMTARMADLQKQITRPDVKLVSFTVDPARDTPAVLKKYAEQYKADESKWTFLTGSEDQMIAVTRGMNIGATKEKDESITHSTFFLLVDRGGRVCGIYRNSDEDSMKQLAADANELAAREP